jgi:hypothetical protein
MERTDDSYTRGYRFGRWYSVVEPDGEVGSAHISACWPISRRDFEYARRNGWRLGHQIRERLHAEMQRAKEEVDAQDSQPGRGGPEGDG